MSRDGVIDYGEIRLMGDTNVRSGRLLTNPQKGEKDSNGFLPALCVPT